MSYNDGQVHLDFYDKDVDFTKIAGEFAEGDPLLQKCLLELWKNGIKTTACCKGHNERCEPYISLVVNNNSKMLIDATCEYIYLQDDEIEIDFNSGGKAYDTFTVHLPNEKSKRDYLMFLFSFLQNKIEYNSNSNNNISLYANYLSKIARQLRLTCRYAIIPTGMMFGFVKPGYILRFSENAPFLGDLIPTIKATGNLPSPISCDTSSLEQFINIIYPNSFVNQDGIKK